MDIYNIRNELNSGKTIYDLPLRVTYYARVSTEKDEQLHSLSAQVHYYSEFIRKCPKWTFVEGYVDEGMSGTSVGKRENFLRMIDDARAGRFDFVVTKEISRFSRNTLDSIQYTQELLKYGVGVLFQSDNINTLMPDAELRLTIMSSIAQDEVRKISERVKFGFKRAVEHGVVLGNSRIWGYEKQNGKLVIKEDEAKIVRMIFDLYANHQMGIRTISSYLGGLGYKNSKGNDFSFSTIRGILSNPKYKGYYCGGKSCKYDYKLNDRKYFSQEEWVMYKDEETVPPIVSEELWEKANLILAKRSIAQSSENKTSYQNKYPYSGKIICGIHKQPYYRSLYRYKSGDKEVWQCQEYNKKGKRGCTSPILYTVELDDIMKQVLEELSIHKSEIIHELVQIYTAIGSSSKADEETARCKASIDDILRRKDKLLDLSIDGRISDKEFSLRNDRFNEEIEKLQKKMKELEAEKIKTKDMMQSIEVLRQAVDRELNFSDGFSDGIIDALLDHIEVFGTDDKTQVKVKVYLRAVSETQEYLIQRRRGRTSVCNRQYI
ncbi:MAG: recombinase family protein [Clostridiales bacterium]|nr:recombinase family protein [Clostridiales bacterium]